MNETRNRRSFRLRGYDYSQLGAYFITICAYQKECLFGEVVEGEMCLNKIGYIVQEEWQKSVNIRQEIELDEFVIMPNHLHGIIFIGTAGVHDVRFKVGNLGLRAHSRAPLQRPARSLSSFVAGFKSSATIKINRMRNMYRVPVWQRNYHEHVVRNESELYAIRQYIVNNPSQWQLDQENPLATPLEKSAEIWEL